MRRNLFLSLFLPYFILLLFFSFLLAISHEKYATFFTKFTVNNAFVLLKNDCEDDTASYEDYESRISKKLSNYRFGTLFYAWLLKTDGTELTVSSFKDSTDELTLAENRERFIPYMRTNQPAGNLQLKSDRFIKFLQYSVIPNTDLIVAVVADVPKNVFFTTNAVIWFIVLLVIFTLFGVIYSMVVANSISLPLKNLMTYGAMLFHGADVVKPLFKDKVFDGLAYFMDGISKKTVVYVDEDRDPVSHMHVNLELENRLFEEIDNKKAFAVCEISISHFHAYLSRYGKKKTNSLIRFTAALVQNSVEEWGNDTDICAHVDRHRFVVVTNPRKAKDISEEIIKHFDNQIEFFYDESDVEKGFILSKNREGDIQSFPLAKILIGIATNISIPLIHPLQIAHITDEIITFLNRNERSAYMSDRRSFDRTPYSEKPSKKGEGHRQEKEDSGVESIRGLSEPDTAKLQESIWKLERTENNTSHSKKPKKKYLNVMKESSKKLKNPET